MDRSVTLSDQALVTLIVLVSRETTTLERAHEAIGAALGRSGTGAEIVYAIGDRCPNALTTIERLRGRDRAIRRVLLTHWFDRAAAVQRALALSRGDRVIVLTAAPQTAPEDLPRLLDALDENDVVLARRDAVRPGLADRLARRLFDTPLGDPACATRAFRRDALLAVGDRSVPYGLMPQLAAWQGFVVGEVAVRRAGPPGDRPRGWLAAASAAAGLPFLHLLLSFAKRPMQLFGAVGAAAFAAGLAISLPLIVARLIFGESLADEPGLMPGLLLTALGIQCVAVGLLAELLIFARNRVIRDYVVERMVE